MNRRLLLLTGAVCVGAALIATNAFAARNLLDVLEAQPQEHRDRYPHRHPRETLEFFGLEPGMTVIEVLPGGGWYSRILGQWLGEEGRLIGADYSIDMYRKFGFFDDAFLEKKKTWIETWTADARGWAGDGGAAVDAFVLGAMPASLEGRADAVLFIRALHNLARFEKDGGYLTTALADAWRALRPGGVVGVVQHLAAPESSDAWADGSNGYLKQQFVIDRFKRAGFEFVADSDVNLNPVDRPTEEENVWRLPPRMVTAGDDPRLLERYREIGESTRMTLLFRKPE